MIRLLELESHTELGDVMVGTGVGEGIIMGATVTGWAIGAGMGGLEASGGVCGSTGTRLGYLVGKLVGYSGGFRSRQLK